MSKVIVIEDNFIFAEYVCRILHKEGLETETASSIFFCQKDFGKSWGE